MSSTTEKALRSRLKQLLRRPENANCADCACEGPKWASFSLGLFLCMKCASIHRSMGTHISKVRSVNLDRWDKRSVQLMSSVGNTKANEYWEANLDPDEHLDERADDRERQSFIIDKYEHRKFVSKKKKKNKKKQKSEGRKRNGGGNMFKGMDVESASPRSRFDNAPRPRRRKSRGYHSSEEVEAELEPESDHTSGSGRLGRRMLESSPWVKAPGHSKPPIHPNTNTSSNTKPKRRPVRHRNRTSVSSSTSSSSSSSSSTPADHTPSQIFSAPTSPANRHRRNDSRYSQDSGDVRRPGDEGVDGAGGMFSGMTVAESDGAQDKGKGASSSLSDGTPSGGARHRTSSSAGSIPDLLNFDIVNPTPDQQPAAPNPVEDDHTSLSFLNAITSSNAPISSGAPIPGHPGALSASPVTIQSSLDFIANAQKRQLPHQRIQQQQQQQLIQQQQQQQLQGLFGTPTTSTYQVPYQTQSQLQPQPQPQQQLFIQQQHNPQMQPVYQQSQNQPVLSSGLGFQQPTVITQQQPVPVIAQQPVPLIAQQPVPVMTQQPVPQPPPTINPPPQNPNPETNGFSFMNHGNTTTPQQSAPDGSLTDVADPFSHLNPDDPTATATATDSAPKTSEDQNGAPVEAASAFASLLSMTDTADKPPAPLGGGEQHYAANITNVNNSQPNHNQQSQLLLPSSSQSNGLPNPVNLRELNQNPFSDSVSPPVNNTVGSYSSPFLSVAGSAGDSPGVGPPGDVAIGGEESGFGFIQSSSSLAVSTTTTEPTNQSPKIGNAHFSFLDGQLGPGGKQVAAQPELDGADDGAAGDSGMFEGLQQQEPDQIQAEPVASVEVEQEQSADGSAFAFMN